MNISDDQLRQYVDNVFDKYDRDKNFTLDEQELLKFFKDLFTSMNFNHNVSMEDVKYSLKQIDANNDGKVTKK
jgi:Ca2+-binding EF-hand superfamily protein